MPPTTFLDIKTNSEIGAMKSRLQKMNRKRDVIAIEIAKKQNLPNLWDLSMVNWDDPNIADEKVTILQLINDINNLHWKIEEAEAINNGELDRHKAKVTVWKFLNSLEDEEKFEYLASVGMSTVGLIEAVMENPDFIQETYRVEA